MADASHDTDPDELNFDPVEDDEDEDISVVPQDAA